MAKDKIYSQQKNTIEPFRFNKEVADVFDDMAERSIPFYSEVQKQTTRLFQTFYQPGMKIYDLGCSTGTTCAGLYHAFTQAGFEDFRIVGIDASAEMCDKAREKLEKCKIPESRVQIRRQDVMNLELKQAHGVIMNYTLQFLLPLDREKLLRKIYTALPHQGILILSDKTHQSHTDLSRIFLEEYYHYKRGMGYSELEIAQKREALESVLIPYSIEEITQLIGDAGFPSIDIFFTWYNFTSFICVKR
ncbi:MAG: carboxy-S-adenosyl-L-methionine synthase CmoA [Spirochaetales bacterium]|nr:carboxy-S-adenosyl-L-methionine synthase CmoA [Spirochaetales bacterium]